MYFHASKIHSCAYVSTYPRIYIVSSVNKSGLNLTFAGDSEWNIMVTENAVGLFGDNHFIKLDESVLTKLELELIGG